MRDAGGSLGAGHVDHFDDGEDVFLDGEFAEDGGFLREVTDAVAGALVHGQARQVDAVEKNRAGGGRHKADDHVKRRRFARAVATEQTDDLAGAHAEADAIDDGAGTKGFNETLGDDLGARARGGGGAHGVGLGDAAGAAGAADLGAGVAPGVGFSFSKPRSLMVGPVRRTPTPSSGSTTARRWPR